MNSKDINLKGQKQEAANQKDQWAGAQANKCADLKGQEKDQCSKDLKQQACAGQAGEQIMPSKGAQVLPTNSQKDTIPGQANLASQKEQSSQARNEKAGQQFDIGKAGESKLQGSQQYQGIDQQKLAHKEHAGLHYEEVTHLGAKDDGVHGQTFIPEEHRSQATAGQDQQKSAGLQGQTGASANKMAQEQSWGAKGDQQKQGKKASERN